MFVRMLIAAFKCERGAGGGTLGMSFRQSSRESLYYSIFVTESLQCAASFVENYNKHRFAKPPAP
eukprot:517912-Amphidinium_carterae.1